MPQKNEERLQKYLAECGVASRRKSEELIAAGKVKVNGHVAQIGDKIDPRRDLVTVRGKKVRKTQRNYYILLHKPRGYVTTLKDELGRRTAADLVADCGKRVFPVGRLDKDSEGLLLFTNDGDLMQRLIHPKFEVSKLYRVTVQGDWRRGIPQLQTMDTLEGEPIAPAQVGLDREMGESAVLLITIHQGKNRQIRRMCRQAGLTVTRLERIAEHGIYLADLPCGKWRALTAEERMRLKESEKK